MSVEFCNEGRILVNLPAEPEMRDKLDSIAEKVGWAINADVAIDFSAAEIVTSLSLCRLLRLRKLLLDRGHRLILCGLGNSTRGIFAVTGLDNVFEFADDETATLTRDEP